MTGLLPHNTGVLTNLPPNGGQYAFDLNGNAEKTFAVALKAAGYQTAFAGKYLNGYQPLLSPVPPGWDDWMATSNGYQAYGYTLNHNGLVSKPRAHFGDQMSVTGRAFMAQALQPFFLELSTFAPHKPYIAQTRYRGLFSDVVMPKSGSYDARPDAAAPQWLQVIPPLPDAAKREFDRTFILRLQSAKGVDDMIGDVRKKLVELGIADTTYVIFTSDNGYHMGEYSLRPGKMTPFDVDVRVPFVIVGPGIAPGSRTDALAMNIDLYPTFLDLAGAPPSATVDGHSLMPVFLGGEALPRNLVVVEHTPPGAGGGEGDPDAADPRAGTPPAYTAVRLRDALYVEYDTGEIGYYDMVTDPDQLHNVVATLSAERLAALHAAVEANRACAGVASCGAAQALMP